MIIQHFKEREIVPDFLITAKENCKVVYFNLPVDVVRYKGFRFSYGIYPSLSVDDLRDIFRVEPYDYNEKINLQLKQVCIWPNSQKDLTEHIKTNLSKGIVCACFFCRCRFGQNFIYYDEPPIRFTIKKKNLDGGYFSFVYEKDSV